MIANRLKGADTATEERLPRRDWILLPCVFFGTAILLAGSTELVGRLIFTQSAPGGAGRCVVLNDASTGARGIPNSVCYLKSLETPIIEYRFNSCGHRAGMECGPKPAGVYRIVMTGSSVAMADLVPQQESFAALLPEALSQKTGRKVQLYNESMGWGFTHSTALRFQDVLAAKPDLILWILTPGDVQRSSLVLPTPEDVGLWGSKNQAERLWLHTLAILGSESGKAAITDFIAHTRTAFMLREILYRSPSLYVKATLAEGDSDEGFLRDPMSAFWKEQLEQVDSDTSTMEAQARDAGVPFVSAYLPNRAQTAMVSAGQWPSGFDPYKLDEKLQSITESHGGTFIDMLPEFRTIPNPERYYLPVDGHPTPEGHAVFTELLAKELTSGVVPELSANQQTRLGAGGGQ